MPFSLSTDEIDDGLVVVALAGELDMAAAPEVAQRLGSLSSDSPLRVVVDLSGLTFIDSSGLNSLVDTARTLEENGNWIVFAAPRPSVGRVFDIVRLDESVALEPTVAGALQMAEIARAGLG